MINLRAGDCFPGLAGLDDRSVDVVITDPPFDSRTHKVAGRTRSLLEESRATSVAFAALTPAQIVVLGTQFARVAKRWIVVFAAERQLEPWSQALEQGGARVVRWGVVLRARAMPQVSGDRPGIGADHIVVAHAPLPRGQRMRWNGGGRWALWNALPGSEDFDGKPPHQTVKSLDLMRKLLLDFTELGELVCDPFAGVGSTAVACQREGRSFIGWEIDAGYRAVALQRLRGTKAGTVDQLALGRQLLELRKRWPSRGPNAKGWGQELARRGIDQRTALRYMEAAKISDTLSETKPSAIDVRSSENAVAVT